MVDLSQNFNEIKQKLLLDEKRIRARLLELKSQDPFNDPSRTVDNAASDTEASEESDHDRVAAMTEELDKELKSVQSALSRITDGTYGKCMKCGKQIDSARLSVMPTATHCVDCGANR